MSEQNQAEHRDVLSRELEHHEELYSGFAQEHFARSAVRAFRRHSVKRILKATGATSSSRMLSLGCGIGDTELLLAPHVRELVGIDLSPAAIKQAREDAAAAGIDNVQFDEGDLDSLASEPASFDCVIAVFFLHHLDDGDLERLAVQTLELLKPGGIFYALDPSRYRLTGAIGKLIVPRLMEKHQSPDERQLRPGEVRSLFVGAGFDARTRIYDFLSTPVAGLFPGAPALYGFTRAMDELLIRIPLLRTLGSNFELIARKPASTA